LESTPLDLFRAEPAVELDAESREDLRRLLGFLDLSQRFDLFFLRYDSEAVLDYVTDALRGRHGRRVVVCALPPGHEDVDPLVEVVRAARESEVEHPIVLLRGLDAVFGPFGERHTPQHVLNERRDLLSMHLTGPLIVALRPLQLQQLWEHAPDFFSIHTAVCRVRTVPSAPLWPAEGDEPWREDVPALQTQLARLEAVPGDESTRLRATLLKRLAAALAARGDAGGAGMAFAQALDAARATGDAAIECDLLLARGGSRLSSDDVDAAERDWNDAAALARRSALAEDEPRLHRLRAGILFARGQLDQALAEAVAAQNVIERDVRPRASAAAAALQGEILYAMRRLDEAATKYQVALATARQASAPLEAGWALLGLANLARSRGDAPGGLPLYDEALSRFRETNYVAGIATALAGQALLLSIAGDRAEAATTLIEARRLFESIGARHQQAQLLLTEAKWARADARLSDATSVLDRAGELARGLGDARLEGQVLHERGRVEILADAYVEASNTLARAATLLESKGALRDAASCHSDRAHALHWLGRNETAIEEWHLALAAAQSAGDSWREAFVLSALGDALTQVQPAAALDFLRHAHVLWGQLGDEDRRAWLEPRMAAHLAAHPELARPSP
jgi:tetratricopeptide (TPR) repeat protein